LTPTICQMVVQLCDGPYNGPDNATGCVATEPLPATLQAEFESEFGIDLFETYGLSETLFVTTEYPACRTTEGVGEPLPRVDLRVEEDGELVVDVPWMFLGYLNQDIEIDTDHSYRTGDLGEIRDGTVHVVGRKKDIIVRNGINISPGRIERLLTKHDDVSGAVVVSRNADGVGERIIALVEPASDGVNTTELHRTVVEKLGADHRLDELVPVESLPETSAERVDHDALDELLKQQ